MSAGRVRNGRRLAASLTVAALALTACSDDGDPAEDSAVQEAQAAADAAQAEAEEAQEALAAETERADAAEADLAAAEAATQEQVDAINAQLTAETQRADDAQETLDALSAEFPIVIDSALDGLELAGTYNIVWAEAYCDTFSNCGVLPRTAQAVIQETPEGWLQLAIPGVFTTALFAVQGSLYGVTDSTDVVPPCNGVPQTGRVTLTLYADGVTIHPDLTRTVDRLGASVTVGGLNAGECGVGTRFLGAELVPAG